MEPVPSVASSQLVSSSNSHPSPPKDDDEAGFAVKPQSENPENLSISHNVPTNAKPSPEPFAQIDANVPDDDRKLPAQSGSENLRPAKRMKESFCLIDGTNYFTGDKSGEVQLFEKFWKPIMEIKDANQFWKWLRGECDKIGVSVFEDFMNIFIPSLRVASGDISSEITSLHKFIETVELNAAVREGLLLFFFSMVMPLKLQKIARATPLDLRFMGKSIDSDCSSGGLFDALLQLATEQFHRSNAIMLEGHVSQQGAADSARNTTLERSKVPEANQAMMNEFERLCFSLMIMKTLHALIEQASRLLIQAVSWRDRPNYLAHVQDLVSKQGANVNFKNTGATQGANANLVEITEEYTPLHYACKELDPELVRLLLAHGADVTAETRSGYTPLHFACRRSMYATEEAVEETIQHLLSQGADANANTKQKYTPLHILCDEGSPRLLRSFLTHAGGPDLAAETDDGKTPLNLACNRIADAEEVVGILLSHGTDVNLKTTCGVSFRGLAPLHIACKWDRLELVRLFLDHEADINLETEQGESPLYIACNKLSHPYQNMVEMETLVRLLLDRGANVHAAKNWRGYTPLHIACKRGHPAIVQLLLTGGANADSESTEGETPLHLACKENHPAVVQLLLAGGANTNSESTKGETPLHLACKENHPAIVQLLLAKGAKPTAETVDGETPLILACKENHLEALWALVHHDPCVLSTPFLSKTAFNLLKQTQNLLKQAQELPLAERNEFLHRLKPFMASQSRVLSEDSEE